jgi:hypothetical protein
LPEKPIDPWPDQPTKTHAEWWEARRARQKEIDDSIARNAEVEYLYDRPYRARGVVRVAGPFTVESLSPHRVLPMGEDPYLEELLAAEGNADGPKASSLARNGAADSGARPEPVVTDFAQVVYENLKTSGVQNTKKGERLMLENLRPFASRTALIQFEGRYLEKGASKRAAVCIGPEYDTVGYELVRRAAREAADLFDTLIVCGFAFAPEVDDTRLNFGRLYAVRKGASGHWQGARDQTTLWTIATGENDEATEHGTQKPVECMRRPIVNNSAKGDLVFEPFAGSGSTLIAAASVGRVCLAVEIDPRYCDVIVERWQRYSQGTATLADDGRTFDALKGERLSA